MSILSRLAARMSRQRAGTNPSITPLARRNETDPAEELRAFVSGLGATASSSALVSSRRLPGHE